MSAETITLQCEPCRRPIGLATMICSRRKEGECPYEDQSDDGPRNIFKTIGFALPMLLFYSFICTPIIPIWIIVIAATVIWIGVFVYKLLFREAIMVHKASHDWLKGKVWRINGKPALTFSMIWISPAEPFLQDLPLQSLGYYPPSVTKLPQYGKAEAMVRQAIVGLLAAQYIEALRSGVYESDGISGKFRLQKNLYSLNRIADKPLPFWYHLERKLVQAISKGSKRCPENAIHDLIADGVYDNDKSDPREWLIASVFDYAVKQGWVVIEQEKGAKKKVGFCGEHAKQIKSKAAQLNLVSNNLAQQYPEFSKVLDEQIASAISKRTESSGDGI